MNPHAEHDGFHDVTSDDPAWIETLWFPFWIPERDLTVYPRVVFQPNAGRYAGSVAAWSGPNTLHFEAPLAGTFDTLDSLGDLRRLSLPDGLSLECLAPGARYRIAFEVPDCSFDVTFDAISEPDYPAPSDSPGMFAGHLDQHGRVTGQLRLGRDTFEVDCGSVRDRSWGPRVVRSDLRLGNAHATGERDCFFAYIQEDGDGRDAIHGGTYLHDGEHAEIVSGVRTTEWDDGWPARLRLEARDARGRSIEAVGTCRNRRAVVANPELYAVLNLVSWQVGDATLWGENHDVWSRTAWLAAGREALEDGA